MKELNDLINFYVQHDMYFGVYKLDDTEKTLVLDAALEALEAGELSMSITGGMVFIKDRKAIKTYNHFPCGLFHLKPITRRKPSVKTVLEICNTGSKRLAYKNKLFYDFQLTAYQIEIEFNIMLGEHYALVQVR